jgi:multidrug efflux pump subunit AcrA (membrane-fusion protein)
MPGNSIRVLLALGLCLIGIGSSVLSAVVSQETAVPEQSSAGDRQVPQTATESGSDARPSAVESLTSGEIIVDNAVLKIVEERNVPARTKGVIKKSNIREGSVVTAGELLMAIDETQQLIELKKSRQELEMATLEADSRVDLIYVERSIEVAQAELERAQRSNQRRPGVVAQSELDQLGLVVSRSIAEKEKTEFQIEMRGMMKQIREAAVELNQHQLQLCQIPAPMSGMIVDVFRREGEWVDASEPVARVVRLDLLRAEIKLPAQIALGDLVGASATFFPRLANSSLQKSYPGKVVFVYPEANPISADVRVWIEIENQDLKLMPGLLGRIEVTPLARDSRSTAKIPSGSMD